MYTIIVGDNMILRKPYAFLIKHFRMIHLIMVVCILYVLLKTVNVFNFLGTYISNGQVISTYEDLSNVYVNTMFVVVVAFLIIVSSIILYLMRHKKKPFFFYVFMIVIYSSLLFLLLFSSSFIYDLAFETPDLRFTNIVKDIYSIEIFIQIPILIISFIRTVGFDIKRFDFKKDILELDISDEDNAEFELQLGLDSEDIRAKLRKKIRYFKYYYKENKIIFFSLIVCVSVFLVISLTRVVLSIEKVYKEREVFSTRYLDITVLDSYKTYYDYSGNRINDDNFYIILKMRYKNKSSSDFQLDLNNSRLSYTEYNNVSPTTLMYNRFVEFGVPYYSQILRSGETRDFILVYEINKEYYDNPFKLKYLYDVEVVNNQPEYKYRTVLIDPFEFVASEEYEIVDTKNLGEELTFTDSLLGNTKIVIDEMDLSNKYTYKLVNCKNNNCNQYVNVLTASTNRTYEMTLMRLNYSITYDSLMGEGYSVSSFIEKFGSIRFVVNGREYDSKIKLFDVTPYPSDHYVFLEVREKLNMAEKIYLDFTVRDKKYTYVIKDEIKEENSK